jgi:YVTN family beta-propeller protein
MSIHPATLSLLVIFAGFSTSCRNSTGPGNGFTHPVGTVVVSPAVASRPFAVAISRDGEAYVGRQDVPYLQASALPALDFADSVRVGSDPTDIAFNASATTAYVTNQFSSNVGVVSAVTGTTIDSISVPGNPFRVLVAPNMQHIFVSSNNDSVYAIAVGTKTIAHRWGFIAPVNGMALSANGAVLYVSSIGGKLYKLNADGSGAVDSVTVGGVPQDVALAPNGSELYLANEAGSLEVRDPATLALVDSVPGASGAFGLKPTPDGVQLYVTYSGAGLIRIIDVDTRSLGPTLAVGGLPRRIAFDVHGTTALVPNESGFVTVVQ